MLSVKDSELHSFSIPLLVDVNIGENWGELHWKQTIALIWTI